MPAKKKGERVGIFGRSTTKKKTAKLAKPAGAKKKKPVPRLAKPAKKRTLSQALTSATSRGKSKSPPVRTRKVRRMTAAPRSH
jgi:hypothetical protein